MRNLLIVVVLVVVGWLAVRWYRRRQDAAGITPGTSTEPDAAAPDLGGGGGGSGAGADPYWGGGPDTGGTTGDTGGTAGASNPTHTTDFGPDLGGHTVHAAPRAVGAATLIGRAAPGRRFFGG
jgi:hypothetical protein